MTSHNFTHLRDLVPGMKNINLFVIVLDVGRPILTKEGREVRTVRVADKTGSVNVSVWDEYGRLINPGDILNLFKVYVSVFKSCMTVYVGKFGEIKRIGEFCMVFSELPDFSAMKPEYKDFVANQQKDKEDKMRKPELEPKNGFPPQHMVQDKPDELPAAKRMKAGPSGSYPSNGKQPEPKPSTSSAPTDPRTRMWSQRDPRAAAMNRKR